MPATDNCQLCRYWSELLATSNGGGQVKAMCLNDLSVFKGQYRTAGQTCPLFADAPYGAIDDPSHHGRNPYKKR